MVRVGAGRRKVAIVALLTAAGGVGCSSESRPGELGISDAAPLRYDSSVEDGAVPDGTIAPPDAGAAIEAGDADVEDDVALEAAALADAEGVGDGSLDASVSDGPAEAGCEAGQTICGGQCTDTSSDLRNCGQCANACGAGVSCINARCDCPPDAGQLLCNNACIDMNGDPSNCGACGHNCQGSTCAGGLCQPTVVAAPPSTQIWGMAVDATTIYWTQRDTTGAIQKKAISGGNVFPLWGGLVDPRGVAVDVNNAYWVDFATGTVYQIALIGGLPTTLWAPPAGAPISPGPVGIAIDTANVYWVENTTGAVLGVPIDGGSLVTISPGGENHPIALALDAASVYWTDQGNTPTTGAVRQAPKDGSRSPIDLASGENSPWAIAIAAGFVYWTERTNPGSIKKVAIGGGGTPITLATNEGTPYGIAVDSQYVYWTDIVDNTVKRLPIGGGAQPQVIAKEQNNPAAITLDQQNVYWVSQGAGTILKVTK